jgi:hypothetical protein
MRRRFAGFEQESHLILHVLGPDLHCNHISFNAQPKS